MTAIDRGLVIPTDPAELQGYVCLWRRLLGNPVWTQLSPVTLKVMLGCLLQANWKERSWYDGKQQVTIPRGSFITSYAKMAEVCKVSTKQVRTAFLHLEKLKITAYFRAGLWTMVTITNYETYQYPGEDSGQGCGQGVGRVWAGLGKGKGGVVGRVRATTNKENKEISKEETLSPTPLPQSDPDLSDLASLIWSNHPKHVRPTLQATERALAVLAMDTPDPLKTAQGIADRHGGWVSSAQWTRDGGRYVPHLLKYLDPREGRWMTEPPEAQSDDDEVMAIIRKRANA